MPPPPPDSPAVFLSYASKDAAAARIAGLLEAAEVRVWRDGDQILGGDNWSVAIPEAIRQSRVLLLLCSPASFESDNVHKEVQITWEVAHRKYLPVWLTEPTRYPDRFLGFLAGCQWVRFAGRADHEWLGEVLKVLGQLGIAHHPNPLPAPPAPPVAAPAPPPAELPLIDSRDAAVRHQHETATRLGVEVARVGPHGLRFQLVPPGRFRMGATDDDPDARANERPRRTVAVARPFWAATFPLTNAVVRQFLDEAESPAERRLVSDRAFAPGARGAGDPDAPAVGGSAADAAVPCGWLCRADGRTFGLGTPLVRSMVLCGWLCRADGRTYRLPTEAEWEYLARAGATGPNGWDGATAWVASAAGPADPRRANAWGMVDVLGNVAEWTASGYGELSSDAPLVAAARLAAHTRVIRGGSWRDKPDRLRLSARDGMAEAARKDWLGVRPVCDFDPNRDRG